MAAPNPNFQHLVLPKFQRKTTWSKRLAGLHVAYNKPVGNDGWTPRTKPTDTSWTPRTSV